MAAFIAMVPEHTVRNRIDHIIMNEEEMRVCLLQTRFRHLTRGLQRSKINIQYVEETGK